jgi:predicted ferric reductase
MVVLVARLPQLERTLGQDRLVRAHRKIGPWAVLLITAHVVLITMGYAASSSTGAMHQFWVFMTTYPDMLAAAAGFALLIMSAITSIRYARSKLRYETWWTVHLYFYLALALSFAHQIVTGVAFVGHPLARGFWITIWAATAGTVLVFRFGLPIWRNVRHRLKVSSVVEEAPGIYSVTCVGHNLSDLAVSGGQFFQWRFMTKGMIWHAHPYSISALPQPPYIRLTVKGVGDQSSAVADLRPGTRVMVEGPYGAFTSHVRRTNHVVLVGAGVGITPLRALLEELPVSVSATVIVRASTSESIPHRNELRALATGSKRTYHEVIGSRHQVDLTPRALKRAVPGLRNADLYVCGPPEFTNLITASATGAKVPSDQIHIEEFAF